MSAGSKNKGSAFEREVCKDLSMWVSGGRQKDLFWRSAMSGGRATLGLRRGEKLSGQAGDISAIHPDGHRLTEEFYVECKFYKSLDLDAFWQGQGALAHFWREAVQDARRHGKVPMLIAKQNITPTMVLVSAGCSLDLDKLVTWRSIHRRGGDISLMWYSTMLKSGFIH